MSVGEMCTRNVVVIDREESVVSAAKLMRQYSVNDVVVIEKRAGKPVPIGLVSETDIITKVIAPELDPSHLRVAEIMTVCPALVAQHQEILPTIELMREQGMVRVPVVDENGILVGIITMHDMVDLLAEELNDLIRALKRSKRKG